jgi:hypothetical protein
MDIKTKTLTWNGRPLSGGGGGGNAGITPLTSADTVAVDLSAGTNFSLTLDRNAVLGNPTGAVPGQSGMLEVIQDNRGGRALAFASAYHAFGTGPAVMEMLPLPGAIAYFEYYVEADGSVLLVPLGDYIPEMPEGQCSFTFDTTKNGSLTTSFKVCGAGSLIINWGDEVIENVSTVQTSQRTFTHTYTSAGIYEIALTGLITPNETGTTPVISYGSNGLVAINGTFPIYGKPVPYMFYYAFPSCGNLEYISGDLFSGLYGPPQDHIFWGTFSRSQKIAEIPAGLFSGIVGPPAPYCFEGVFYQLSTITSLPEGLFAGLEGPPAQQMFREAFVRATSLATLPEGLFAGITGDVKSYMFEQAFSGDTKLTSIPDNFIGNLTGSAQSAMFQNMFGGCTSLTGESIIMPNGNHLYEQFPDATTSYVSQCYRNCTGLTDYDSIPDAWK